MRGLAVFIAFLALTGIACGSVAPNSLTIPAWPAITFQPDIKAPDTATPTPGLLPGNTNTPTAVDSVEPIDSPEPPDTDVLTETPTISTGTPNLPTATLQPPTDTPIPPKPTLEPPTNTPIPPTNTPLPPPTQPPPTLTPVPVPTRPSCDPSYPTVCIPPPPPDLDCGEIPHRRFQVLQPDPHWFDGDENGIGCERD